MRTTMSLKARVKTLKPKTYNQMDNNLQVKINLQVKSHLKVKTHFNLKVKTHFNLKFKSHPKVISSHLKALMQS